MSNKRQLVVVAGAFGALTAAFVIRRLLSDPEICRRLGIGAKAHRAREAAVDMALDHSFPASDPPSFTPITSIGGTH